MPITRQTNKVKAAAEPVMGVNAVLQYSGLGARKLGSIKTVGALKKYIKGQLAYLHEQFNVEIAEVQSKEYPLAQGLEFSNIDDAVEDAALAIETVQQNLTAIRSVALGYGRQILAIAHDLQEEIKIVSSGGKFTILEL
ncbi:hypothetical protein ABW21_db0207940 [Orbilia brochopaga]|nr:hypothetical protein ABW21_db0207940 [Drechslerella brochopaga]